MSGKEGGGQPPNLPTLGTYVSSIQTGLQGGGINSTASSGPMLSQAPPLGASQHPHISQQGVTMTIGPRPVDMVKSGNSLAQIRIPNVSGASIQRVPVVGSVSSNSLTRPTIFTPQVSVVTAPGRPLVGGVTVSKPPLSVSNITMLPNTGRVTSLAQVRPGTRPVLTAPQSRPVLTAPQSARPSNPHSARPTLGTPIIRGGQVQSILPGQLITHQVRPLVSSAGPRGPRPATVVPVGVSGTRHVPGTMTAVSFRPVMRPSMDGRPLTTMSMDGRPLTTTLATHPQTVAVSKSMLSPGSIKPLTLQQSHFGVGISPQVGVASQVALKHGGPLLQAGGRSTASLTAVSRPGGPPGAGSRPGGPAGPNTRMVSPTSLVSLTPATHIQVPMVPTGPKARVQRIVASTIGGPTFMSTSSVGGPTFISTSTTVAGPGHMLVSSAPTLMDPGAAATLMAAQANQAALISAAGPGTIMTAGGPATFMTAGGPGAATLIATGPPLSSSALGGLSGGTVQITTPRTITLPYSGAHVKPGLSAASAAVIPVARVTPQQSQPRDMAGSTPFVYLPVTRADLGPGGPRQVTANMTAAGIRSTSEFGGGASSGHGGPPAQSAPVNLTVSDRNVRVPAMTMPSFTPTIRYDAGSGRAENSVTITTLPPGSTGHLAGASLGPLGQEGALHVHTGPATLSPAKITPVLPSGGVDQDKQVPGSPRPSILRKRDGEGTPIKAPPHQSSAHTPPSSRHTATTPPARPDSSSGSSTVSAPSSAALSGDEHQTTVSTATTQLTAFQELTPRKKPRKQQLPPASINNVSPEWMAVKREIGARDRMEWEEGRGGGGSTRMEWEERNRVGALADGEEPGWGDRVKNWQGGWGEGEVGKGGGGWGEGKERSGWGGDGKGRGGWGSWDSKETDQADDEEEMTSEEEKEKFGSSILKGKPRMSLKDNKPWKSRHNHFLRHSDVKPKDEKKPTVNELANQKYVYQKMNGWKVYHLSAGMEDIIDAESEISRKLEEVSQKLEDTANEDVSLTKILELLKANIQRSKVIQEQLKEAKQHSQNVFSHKSTMQNIILKYHNKRTTRRTEKKII